MTTPLRRFDDASSAAVSLDWESAIGDWSQSKDIVPITGAGLGMNFQLPSWLELTDRLCDALESAGGTSLDAIRGERDLLIKAFRCTHQLRSLAASDPNKVTESIADALYRDLEITPVGTAWMECTYQLARLTGLHITFNFDDLFEAYSNMVHDTKAIISRSGRSPRRIEGQIDSFHAHGIIPYRWDRDGGETRIVFDSISYIEAYAEFLDRLSTALLYVLTNFRCVFLGLSMTDPNLLRLIRLSRQLRNDDVCWGIVFGTVLPELRDVLIEWGLAVVDDTGSGSFDFAQAPRLILASIRGIDPPEFDNLFEKFTALFRT